MNIVYKKLKDLIPYENNPRRNEAAVDAVAKSIKNFGSKVPVVIDCDNTIVCGHTRVLAAEKLKIDGVPTIVADDLSPEQIKAYRLADNKVSEIATWDDELLRQELEELSTLDFDMAQFGFDVDIDTEEMSIPEDDDFDILEAIEKETTTEYGDIFQLGDHFLMCGDSTNLEDVKKLTRGGSVDLVVTDPPYNVDYEGSTKDKLKIQNDNFESDEEFTDFLEAAFRCMQEVMKPGASFYIWHASRSPAFYIACNRAGFTVRQTLIWNKNKFVLSRQDYHWKHEPCLYGWKDGAAHYFINNRKLSTMLEDCQSVELMSEEEVRDILSYILGEGAPKSVIDADKPLKNKEHPTMKPIPLLAKNIQNSSRRGDSVLDLFGGSGSTLIACEQMNRKCFMMELDPIYVDVIVKRWEELTGKKANKLVE